MVVGGVMAGGISITDLILEAEVAVEVVEVMLDIKGLITWDQMVAVEAVLDHQLPVQPRIE